MIIHAWSKAKGCKDWEDHGECKITKDSLIATVFEKGDITEIDFRMASGSRFRYERVDRSD